MDLELRHTVDDLLKPVRLPPSRGPRQLYHYTSAEGFLSIVQSNGIWATAVKYLNDATEYSLATSIAADILAERQARAHGAFDKALLAVMATGLRSVDDDVYVASFTENGDQLSQWRGYSPDGRGYSLGFSTRSIARVARQTPVRFLFRCAYDSEAHEQLIASLVDDITLFAGRLYRPSEDNRDRVLREAHKRFARLFPLIAPAVKDASFAEEQEWRLISLGTSFPASAPSFRAGRSMLVPYYHLPLASPGRPLPLDTLIVGPTPLASLAEHSASQFLLSHGLTETSVSSSRIPYRSW